MVIYFSFPEPLTICGMVKVKIYSMKSKTGTLEKDKVIWLNDIIQENKIIRVELNNVENAYIYQFQKPSFNYCSLGLMDGNYNIIALFEGFEEFKEIFFGEQEYLLKSRIKISKISTDYKLGLVCGVWRFFFFNPIFYAIYGGKVN